MGSRLYLPIVFPYVKPALKNCRFHIAEGSLHSNFLEFLVAKEIVSLLEKASFDIETAKKRFSFTIFDSSAHAREKKIQSITLVFCSRLAAKVGALIDPSPDGSLDWHEVLDLGISIPVVEAVTDSFLPNFLTKAPPRLLTEPQAEPQRKRLGLVWPFRSNGAL